VKGAPSCWKKALCNLGRDFRAAGIKSPVTRCHTNLKVVSYSACISVNNGPLFQLPVKLPNFLVWYINFGTSRIICDIIFYPGSLIYIIKQTLSLNKIPLYFTPVQHQNSQHLANKHIISHKNNACDLLK
jgi:hypothetical protein